MDAHIEAFRQRDMALDFIVVSAFFLLRTPHHESPGSDPRKLHPQAVRKAGRRRLRPRPGQGATCQEKKQADHGETHHRKSGNRSRAQRVLGSGVSRCLPRGDYSEKRPFLRPRDRRASALRDIHPMIPMIPMLPILHLPFSISFTSPSPNPRSSSSPQQS